MRKYTVIEKIFRNHSEEEIEPGKIVWIDLDVVSARDFAGPNVVKNFNRSYSDCQVFDKDKVCFTFDLTVPPKTIQYANNQQLCREFAVSRNVKVYDVDRGIGTHALIEEGRALPGSIVVGTDSHMNILGAVNCFGQGMGDVDISFGFRYGRTWFEVPETVKVNITGKSDFKYSAKDLALFILGHLKTDKILGKAVEFYGEAIESLDLAGRITLLSMITEMGGIVGFIPFTDKTSAELRDISASELIPDEIRADKGADYSEELSIDVSALDTYVVAKPPYPHNVCRVSELKDKVKVDFGFIGSCTNGRIEDLRIARDVLKGKKIAKDVRLAVVPATKEVYTEAMKEGILADLLESGAIISNPGCGGCAQGHIGMTGKGEVMISTGNRNFPGKQGDGNNFLASPELVALSVLRGYIYQGEES